MNIIDRFKITRMKVKLQQVGCDVAFKEYYETPFAHARSLLLQAHVEIVGELTKAVAMDEEQEARDA
jgi:hypothetical protein